MKIIARDQEVSLLEKIYASNVPEFLAIYGRRRVGKTYLIRTFFMAKKGAVFFNVTGAKKAPMKEQIAHFMARLGETFYHGSLLESEKNWDAAFHLLTQAIKNQVPKNKKIILFFDELPWMATPRSRLLESIDYYWNQYWSNDQRIKLVVCGSSAAWIINKIIHHTGGLHNRITREIHLDCLNLLQTKQFLQHQGVQLNHAQILQLFIVMGGVPFYLSKVEKGLSATQILEQLAFTKKAFFLDEFGKLFSSLFDNSEEYIRLVRLLSESRYGLGERELLEKMGKNFVGAKGIKILNDLEQTGFVMSFKPLYHHKKGLYYRLTDEYVLFYLKWIEPIQLSLEKKALGQGYLQQLQATPEWYNWLGLSFESVCYKHLSLIKKALNLGPMALASTWRYVPIRSSKNRGAQIDLLFDRKDDAITLCEIKCTSDPYVFTKSDWENLNQKIAIFKEQTRTKKQIFVSLISANGLKHNIHTKETIHHVVTLDDFFD